MTSEQIREILRISYLNLYYVTPDPAGEVIILREYDKGYLGVYRHAEKALELNLIQLNEPSRQLLAKYSKPVPKSPPAPIPARIPPKPKRK